MAIEPYYDRDGITIYHANCLDVLPQIEHVDHVITDPPYESEAHTLARRSGKGGDARKQGVAKLVVDFGAMTEELRAESSTEMSRITRRWLLLFCQVEAAMEWRGRLQLMRYVRTQVWIKPDSSPQFSGDRPAMGYESILTCHANGVPMTWNGGGRRGVYIYGSKDHANRPEGHATPKPLPLMRELVELFTNPGDLIIDPFMGTGTTLRAAKDLGRRAIGIELEEKWCEEAVKRLAQEVLPL